MKRIRYTKTSETLLTSTQYYFIEYNDSFVEVQVEINLADGTLALVSQDGEVLFSLTDTPSKLKKVAKYTLVQMGCVFEDEVRNRLNLDTTEETVNKTEMYV